MVKSIPRVSTTPTYPVSWHNADTQTRAVFNRPDGTSFTTMFLTQGSEQFQQVPKYLSERFGILIDFANTQPRQRLRAPEVDPTASKNDGETLKFLLETYFTEVLLNPGLYSYVLVLPNQVDPDTALKIERYLKQQFKVSAENVPCGALFHLQDFPDDQDS